MSSIMNDSFDEAIANMEMPEDPGPSANIQFPNDKPDEKHTKTLPSSSSSMTTTNSDNNATTNTAASIVATTTTSYSKSAIQVNPNQKGNPLLKGINNLFLHSMAILIIFFNA